MTRRKSLWFIETRNFTASWTELRLGATDLTELQDLILIDPKSHPVVSGTGGLRKIRFASKSHGKGKRGALRVCYAFLERFSAVVLVLVYAKNEKVNLSPAEKKVVKAADSTR